MTAVKETRLGCLCARTMRTDFKQTMRRCQTQWRSCVEQRRRNGVADVVLIAALCCAVGKRPTAVTNTASAYDDASLTKRHKAAPAGWEITQHFGERRGWRCQRFRTNSDSGRLTSTDYANIYKCGTSHIYTNTRACECDTAACGVSKASTDRHDQNDVATMCTRPAPAPNYKTPFVRLTRAWNGGSGGGGVVWVERLQRQQRE